MKSKLLVFLISYAFILTVCHCRCGYSLQASIKPAIVTYSGLHGTYCQWSIYSPIYSSIQLTVISLRHGRADCSGSIIEIGDGSVFGRRIAKLCTVTSTVFRSTGKYMEITYHAAANNENDRLKFKYWAFDSSACHGGLKTAFPQLQYIDYSNDSANTDCKWLIDTEDMTKVVELQVISSSMEQSPQYWCSTVHMEAFDGYDSTFRSLQRWCGKVKPNLKSTGRYMYLEFQSRTSTETTFRIAYSAISPSVEIKSTADVAIAVGVVAGIVIFIIIVCCLCCRKKRQPRFDVTDTNRAQPTAPPCTTNVNLNIYAISIHNRSRSVSNSSTSSSTSSPTSPPTASPPHAPPPAYDEVVKDDTNLPPSYTDAVEQHMIHVDASNQAALYVRSRTVEAPSSVYI